LNWSQDLDPTIFSVAYCHFRGEKYTPESSKVEGTIGKVMDILDVYTAVGGCKENEQIPALLIQALQPHRFSIESEVHKFLERVTKDIKVIQSIHHQQYHETYWSNKVQLLESFSKSINEGQIFDHIAVANNEISEFEDCLRDMQIPELSKLVECVDWL
jgi:hypothetical protein